MSDPDLPDLADVPDTPNTDPAKDADAQATGEEQAAENREMENPT